MIHESVVWIGKSGTQYEHFVYDLDSAVPNRLGTYVYAKQNESEIWAPVFMGHGSLSQRCPDPELLGRIRAKGATHVHLRLNAMEQDGAAELEDMLANYPNAFVPHGCNVKLEERVHDSVMWVGKSGIVYEHFVYALNVQVPDRPGTFIYSKQNAEAVWVPVYMGQGSLAGRCEADEELMARIHAKNATHVHLRLNPLEADRGVELQDLLEHYANAYEPLGCHVRATE